MDKAISICEHKLKQDDELGMRTDMDVDTIVRLLRFCVKSTEFQYDGTHYKQLDGLAMSLPVSLVLADLFIWKSLKNKHLKRSVAGHRPAYGNGLLTT